MGIMMSGDPEKTLELPLSRHQGRCNASQSQVVVFLVVWRLAEGPRGAAETLAGLELTCSSHHNDVYAWPREDQGHSTRAVRMAFGQGAQSFHTDAHLAKL